MSGNLAPHSRHVFSSLWLCAAVLLFIMCSDAARASASPISTQANSGVRPNILSSLFPPSNPHHPLSTGRLPPEPGTNSGTEMSRKSGEALSITNHQSNPPWFTGGVFSYNPNSPDWRQHSRGGIIRAQRGHSSGGARPASESFISHPEQGGQSAERPQSRLHYQPLSQKVTQSGNSNPTIVRVSSQNQMWDPRDAQKSYNEEKVPRNDKISWVSQPGEYWSNSPSTLRAHHGGDKEMDQLSAVRVQSTSNRIQSSKFFGSASQTASRAPSTSAALDTSAFRINPRSEKVAQTLSVTDFSMKLNSMTTGETSRPKMVQSYLFKDSQASSMVRGDEQQAMATMPQKQMASDAQIHSRFASTFEKLLRNDAIKENDANPLNLNKNMGQYGAQMDNFKTYQPVSSTYPPAQPPLHPASGKGRTLERFIPAPLAISQDNYATSREKYPAGRSVSTARGSAHGYKPDRSTKSIYGLSGFENWRSNSGKYSFNKVRIQATTVSPPRLFTSGRKDVQPLLPESDASTDVDPNPTWITSKIMSGFDARPLEGAKPPVREQDRPATHWPGVNVVSSQTWQPKSSRSNTWKNNKEDFEAENHSISTQRQKEKSSEDFKQKSEHSRFTPEKYKKKHSIYTFMGFQSLQDRIGSPHWNYTTVARPTGIVSSSYLRSAAGLHLESSPTTQPTTHKTKPVTMRARQFHKSPSSTVIGEHVRAETNKSGSFPTNAAIVRLPKLPVKVAVTFADILGSASFKGVRATTQTLMTQADKKDYFPKTMQEEGRGSWTSDDGVQSRTRGAKDEVEDFSRNEENAMKTFDAFLDNEGSGSGAFNVSDVLSADSPQSQGLSEDLLELDYLRTATGNISFKSVKLFQPEK
nr:PREDICTED: uncharacterized protein LOC109634698 [Paralichthys olivaceus]